MPTTESYDIVRLSPEEISRIKDFLMSLNQFNDGSMLLKDPSGYCRSFSNCYDCVKSMWYPCGWCHNLGCTERPEKICPTAATNVEISNITGEIKACPHIYHNGPVLVPAGVNMYIKVNVYLPDPIVNDKEIICQIRLKNRHMHLKALLINNMVYCIPMILKSDLLEYGDTERGSLRVIWGGAQPYSNEVPLLVYSCEALATECESCRMIPAAYQCGWCDDTQSCVTGDKCADDLMKWTLNRLTCEPYSRKLFYV
ncbi:uncharacterized protein LOC142977390 [Anticarsia gemmatalis]|uniref:uncharacterized protein LOC142977390 n=1 Tax=Anticarsia gemmatalis TaxID=129554 RepID=UPI003F75DC25